MKVVLLTPPGGRLTSWAEPVRYAGADPVVAHTLVEVLEHLSARGGPPAGVVIDAACGDRVPRIAHVVRAFRGETAVFVATSASHPDGRGEWCLPVAIASEPASLPAFLRGSSAPAFAPAGSSRFIELNGHRMHYLDWSPSGGRPLLVLPGKSGIAADAAEIAALLHPYFRVLSVDYRGYGYSEWSRDPYSVNLFAADTVELIRALDLRDLTIVASCFGVTITAGLVEAISDRLRRIVFSQMRPEQFWAPLSTRGSQAYLDLVTPRSELLTEQEARTFLTNLGPGVTNPVWHETRFRHAFIHTKDGLTYRLDPKINRTSVYNFDEFYAGFISEPRKTRTVFERVDCPVLCFEYPGLLDDDSARYLASRSNVTIAKASGKAYENFEPAYVAALAEFLDIL